MKRTLQAGVALLLLWMVLRNLDLGALARVLGRFRWLSVGAAVALSLLAWCLATSKWRIFWRKATWWDMLKSNFVAQFYSLILPGQLAGEVVKTYRLGRRFSNTTGIAASVLVDRATSLMGLLLLAFGGTVVSRKSTPSGAMLLLSLSVFGVAAVLYGVTLPWVFRAAVSVVSRIGGRHEALQVACRKTIEFLSAWTALMSTPRTILAAISLGAVFQAMAAGVNYIVATDLGIEVRFSDWCWVLGLVSVALLLPITIAGIGVREGAYAGLLGLLGVPPEQAVAVSFMMFGISLVGALVGAIFEFSFMIQGRERLSP